MKEGVELMDGIKGNEKLLLKNGFCQEFYDLVLDSTRIKMGPNIREKNLERFQEFRNTNLYVQ